MTPRMEVNGSRRLNRLRVIQALFQQPASTRSAIAEATGLSRPTVTGLLEGLQAAGIVEERDTDGPRRGAGRPPTRHALVPDAAFAVGLDVGHRHVRAAVCDLAGHVMADEFCPTDVDGSPHRSLDLARDLVNAVLERAGVDRVQLIGVGMGLAAPIDSAGTPYVEGIMPAWGGIHPAEEMQRRLDLPVQLANDANVGALGEHAFGAGRGAREMAYVRLSAGIGLGLVLHGRPYRGAAGVAGELGHVLAVEDGLVCRCGNRGCLETVASPVAAADLLERSRGSAVGVGDLIELMRAGDRGALGAVADAGTAVGKAIAGVVNLLNPELIVIGGDFAEAGPVLLDPVRRAIARHAILPAASGVRVVPGELGERAEVLGAAALLLAQAPQALVQRLVDA